MSPYLLAAMLATAATASGQRPPPAPADARATAALDAPGPKRPISIRAPSFKVLGRENRAIYSGGVVAVRDKTRLTCQTLTAYFDAKGEVNRLDCVGKVVATDGDKWARGEKATYDNASAILEVTGNPEARQGPHRMRGSLVRFYVGTDVIEVVDADTQVESRAGRARTPPPKQERSTP